jgi:hypothetical protein
MKFKKTLINYVPCHISGLYKCVNYGGHWFAFYKLRLSDPWGNSCYHTTMGNSERYKTLAEAQQACEKHNNEGGLQ